MNLLKIPEEIVEDMIGQVEHCLPEEACGLVGGREGRFSRFIFIENELHSPVRFRMAPVAQLKAMDQIEQAGLDVLAIWHSHPKGPAGPSATDVAEFYYPESAVLIVSPCDTAQRSGSITGIEHQGWQVRAFRIIGKKIEEICLVLVK